MTIHLFFSNRLEALADKYAGVIDLENQTKPNILEGPFTIVPNQNLTKWLQLTLAAKRSVFMNVDFQYLEAGLWQLLSRIDPRTDPPEMMTGSHVRMFLLKELMGLKADHPALGPIRQYLLDPAGKKGPDYAVKLWQLTERMGQLFEAYQFHRADMMARWPDKGYRAEGMEGCQQALYRMMRASRDRYAQAVHRRLLSLGEYADEVLAQAGADSGRSRPEKFVHLFGLSQVSPFHLRLIGRLKEHYTICIYSLNPCREFWEDIRTPQERRWIERRAVKRLEISREELSLGEILEPEENELLAMWGKPGREHIRLLCELTDYDFNVCFSKAAGPSSVLGSLQHYILTLSTEKAPAKGLPQDTSLQIMACPGIYREVETVYNSILYHLNADPQLQLTDIAVFVSDMSAYKPAIDSVFNRRPRRVVYNLVDSRADIESVYGQAVTGILDLTAGRFSRKEVFDLLMNPCFMGRWGIRFEDVAIWAGWADDLNIFHGFDPAHKGLMGYPAGDAYTWKQGLQRLRLSRILSPPEEDPWHEGQNPGFRSFGGRIPFLDVHTGDTDLLEKFSIVIERLYRCVTELAGVIASGEEWAGRFLKICDELLTVPPDLRGESAVQKSLAETLGDLKIWDALRKEDPEKGDAGLQLNIEMMRELIRSSLGAISGGHGDYLTDGVTISALQPMRPIPFRIVYVLGMQEGAFPGRADASSLDLRLQKRRIGDVNLPERNRYLFLEMLLSVREKLYISYVARDLQKDRVIQPCSVVNQLRRVVEQEILSSGDGFCVAEIPLKGTSIRYVSTDAVSAASDVVVNYSVADRIACYQENGLWEDAKRTVPEALRERVQACFPDFTLAGERALKDEGRTEKVSVRQLRMFLEDPVSQGLKRHLGVYEEEASIRETTLKEDEPFYSQFPVDYRLRMTPLALWLDRFAASGRSDMDLSTLKEIYDGVYERLQRMGAVPEGAFGELDRKAMGEDVFLRAETLGQVITQLASGEKAYRALFLGEQTGEVIAPHNQFSVERFEPLRVRVGVVDASGEIIQTGVEVHGQLSWIWKEIATGWHVLVLTGSGKKPGSVPDKYLLEPLLFWLCCLSIQGGREWIGTSDVTFHVVYKEQVKVWTYGVEPEAAATYITRLVSDYLARSRPEWLPFETVTSQSIKPHRMSEEEIGEGSREVFYAGLREAYADEASLMVRLADPHIPEDAFDRVRERFGIFFQYRRRKRP